MPHWEPSWEYKAFDLITVSKESAVSEQAFIVHLPYATHRFRHIVENKTGRVPTLERLIYSAKKLDNFRYCLMSAVTKIKKTA